MSPVQSAPATPQVPASSVCPAQRVTAHEPVFEEVAKKSPCRVCG